MIAGDVADQAAETADVVEQFVVDAAVGIAVGRLQGLVGARGIAGPQPGKRELAQERWFRDPRASSLLEVLHCFLVSTPLERDRSEPD